MNLKSKNVERIIMFIAIAILGAFAINIAFKSNWHTKLLEAEWEASDALNYFGVILSIIGTVRATQIGVKMTIEEEKKSQEKKDKQIKCEEKGTYLTMVDKIILLSNGEKITTPYNFEQNEIILIQKKEHKGNSSGKKKLKKYPKTNNDTKLENSNNENDEYKFEFFKIQLFFKPLNNIYPSKIKIKNFTLHLPKPLALYQNHKNKFYFLSFSSEQEACCELNILISKNGKDINFKNDLVFECEVEFLNPFNVVTTYKFWGSLKRKEKSNVKNTTTVKHIYTLQDSYCNILEIHLYKDNLKQT